MIILKVTKNHGFTVSTGDQGTGTSEAVQTVWKKTL